MPVTLKTMSMKYREDPNDSWSPALVQAIAPLDPVKEMLGIIIDGKRPDQQVSSGQYVIVKNSTITGITDGIYTANAALSPSTDVTAANLTAVTNGGLNSLKNSFNAQWISVYGAVSSSWNAQELQLTADISSCIALAFVFSLPEDYEHYTVITPIIAGIPYSGGGTYGYKTISPEVRAYNPTTNKITIRPLEWSSSSSNGPRPLVGIYALKIAFN